MIRKPYANKKFNEVMLGFFGCRPFFNEENKFDFLRRFAIIKTEKAIELGLKPN